jgi:NitT/TauT family transport system substrate-binding protein
MSLRKTISALAAACLLFVSGCSSAAKTETEPVKVLAPQGAPALAVMGMEGDNVEIDYVDGQDLLLSELSKTDGEYDIIAAPVNLGVKTWKEAETYQLNSILTWGNLYIVSETEDWDSEGQTIALFGEGAVPGLVFTNLFPELAASSEYYASVSEASQALLAKQADSALLAQPAAAAAINKGTDQDLNLSTVVDIQQLWQEKYDTSTKGYPQAALFVKKGSEEKVKDALKTLQEFLDDADTESIETKVDAYGADVLGVPSAKLAAATWNAQNIHYVPAAEAKEDLAKFLDVFGLAIPEGLIEE